MKKPHKKTKTKVGMFLDYLWKNREIYFEQVEVEGYPTYNEWVETIIPKEWTDAFDADFWEQVEEPFMDFVEQCKPEECKTKSKMIKWFGNFITINHL